MSFDISQQDFFIKYGINEDQFHSSSLDWTVLVEIANDWLSQINNYRGKVREITNLLYECSSVHSIRYRIKNPEHLIDKIIRKTIENTSRIFSVLNYRKEIKDLGGIRILHLYKHQNIDIHNFIVSKGEFKLEEKIAYLRRQEELKEQQVLQDLGFDTRVQSSNEKIYSSLHYIFDMTKEIQSYFFEIQVRTIFEEGWAEIDHQFNYPKRTNCLMTKDAIENLNHAVFLCNNLATTVYNLSGTTSNCVDNVKSEPEAIYQACKNICITNNYATAKLLQMELHITYTLAKEIIERMETEQFVSYHENMNTPRVILG